MLPVTWQKEETNKNKAWCVAVLTCVYLSTATILENLKEL